ncbi:hypothetical protein NKJ71_13535 [Mesorhizobium sp. M0050]|uniref:hypothetical protein n=1 Tax=Mesorhizobium sp. M0050 TaxID=2956861 RepID=UPI00333A0047
MEKPSQEQFLDHVASHVMTVNHDAPPFRTLLFKTPETSNRYFRITTWPGALAISGDMGCFVFSRLPDMFEFFRKGRGINPGYWSEKLIAHDKHGGHMAFSEEMYHDAIRRDFRQWEFEDWRQMRRAWAEVREELWHLDNLHDAVSGAYRYRCSETGGDFSDIWGRQLEDYTYHFIWCCRAIVWAIAQYDAAKAAANDNSPVAVAA